MEPPQLCHVHQPRLDKSQVDLAGEALRRLAQRYSSALQAGQQAQ